MLLSHRKSKLTQFTLRTLVPAVLAASLLAGSAARADLTNFTGSNLVLMRGGDAANPQSTLGTGQVPAYLDQYSVSVSGGIATATYLGQYAIPTSTLTLPGITVNSHEGRLELSGNGQYIDFGGYKQPVGAGAANDRWQRRRWLLESWPGLRRWRARQRRSEHRCNELSIHSRRLFERRHPGLGSQQESQWRPAIHFRSRHFTRDHNSPRHDRLARSQGQRRPTLRRHRLQLRRHARLLFDRHWLARSSDSCKHAARPEQ